MNKISYICAVIKNLITKRKVTKMAKKNAPNNPYRKLYVEPPIQKYYLPVTGNLSEDSFFRLATYCEANHINRSAFIGEILEKWIDTNIPQITKSDMKVIFKTKK